MDDSDWWTVLGELRMAVDAAVACPWAIAISSLPQQLPTVTISLDAPADDPFRYDAVVLALLDKHPLPGYRDDGTEVEMGEHKWTRPGAGATRQRSYHLCPKTSRRKNDG